MAKLNYLSERYPYLKIPEGCVIVYNNFFDVEPPFEDPLSDKWGYFKEMLLQILYIKSRPQILLDLEWYPEFDPQGRFVIQVFREDFRGEQLLKFESRSTKEVVEKIYEIFTDVVEGRLG